MDDRSAPFRGFAGAMAFFEDLRANNDRTWFAANKARYEQSVREPAEAFVGLARPQLEAIAGRRLGARIFRIHRDIRFSKDKSPYSTHLHIGFMAEPPPGQRHGIGFYFGLEADHAGLAAGTFDLAGAALDRYRAAVADEDQGGALASLLADLAQHGCRLDEPALKRVPAPYPPDHPRGDLLRRKGLTVWREMGDPAHIEGPGLLDEAVRAYREMAPLNAWIEEALGEG